MSKINDKYNRNQINKQKKHVCLDLAIKSKVDHWFSSYVFFEYLKTQFQKSLVYNYSAISLYNELKSRGYPGTLRTVQRHIRVLKNKGLAYKKDFHLFLVSEKQCYILSGNNHKIHTSKHLADLLMNYDSFDVLDLIKELAGKSDPEGNKYTPGRIKSNIKHLSVKGFLRYDSDKELYELRKELYQKRSYTLTNQHWHTIRLFKSDSIKAVKDKIITAILKLSSERKRYFVNKGFYNNRLTTTKGRKLSQSEVKAEKPQSNSVRELARFTNYSLNTVNKYMRRAISEGWMQRDIPKHKTLLDAFGAVMMPGYIFNKRREELTRRTGGHVYLDSKGIVKYIKPANVIFKQLIFS